MKEELNSSGIRDLNSVDDDPSRSVRTLFGVTLILLGLIVVCTIMFCVVSIVFGNLELPIIQKLNSIRGGSQSISIPGGSMVLPPGLFTFGSYGILFGLLSISSAIGCSLIRSGSSLLYSDNKKMLRQLLTEQAHYQAKLLKEIPPDLKSQ